MVVERERGNMLVTTLNSISFPRRLLAYGGYFRKSVPLLYAIIFKH